MLYFKNWPKICCYLSFPSLWFLPSLLVACDWFPSNFWFFLSHIKTAPTAGGYPTQIYALQGGVHSSKTGGSTSRQKEKCKINSYFLLTYIEFATFRPFLSSPSHCLSRHYLWFWSLNASKAPVWSPWWHRTELCFILFFFGC